MRGEVREGGIRRGGEEAVLAVRVEHDMAVVEGGVRFGAHGPADGAGGVARLKVVLDNKVGAIEKNLAGVTVEDIVVHMPEGQLRSGGGRFRRPLGLQGAAEGDGAVDLRDFSIDSQDVVRERADAEDIPTLAVLQHVPEIDAGRFQRFIVLHPEVGRPGDAVGLEVERTLVDV